MFNVEMYLWIGNNWIVKILGTVSYFLHRHLFILQIFKKYLKQSFGVYKFIKTLLEGRIHRDVASEPHF